MAPSSHVDGPGNSPTQAQADNRDALFQMIMGFRISQMIYVAVKLGIPDLLKDGPKEANELARQTGTHGESLYRLLRALASLGIFYLDEQDLFRLTPLAELLQLGAPGSLRTRALHYGGPEEWGVWGDMLHCVTTGGTSYRHQFGMDVWEYREQNPQSGGLFDELMAANTSHQTAAILPAYDFSTAKTVIDVGGGHGALVAAILKANPNLRGALCDAPHVLAGARAFMEEAGLTQRCQLIPCDFFMSVPVGGDIYLLKFILHDWPDEQASAILSTCRRAMQEGSRLLVVEHIIQRGNSPDPGKLLDMQMLVEQGGRERTEEEFRTLFRNAGFELTRCIPTDGVLYVIEGMPV